MESLADFAYQFFHGPLFLGVMISALIASFIHFRSCLLARVDKNKDKFEKKSLKLWLSTAIIVFAYLFYIQAYFDLDYQLLNVIFISSFSLMIIIVFISWFDKWRLGQKTLDNFCS